MLKVPEEYLSYTDRTSSSLAGKNCKKAVCRRDYMNNCAFPQKLSYYLADIGKVGDILTLI